MTHRNRQKNIQYAKEWNTLHRGPGHRRRVAKRDRPIGIQARPNIDAKASTPPSTPFLPSPLDYGLEKRHSFVGAYPADWTKEDIAFWLEQ